VEYRTGINMERMKKSDGENTGYISEWGFSRYV